MRITQQQFDSLGNLPKETFARRSTEFLRHRFPEAANSPLDEVLAAVRIAVQRGEIHGLRAEQDLAAYVLTSFLLGSDFDTEFPAAYDVLFSPVLEPSDKALWLTQWTEEMFLTLAGGY